MSNDSDERGNGRPQRMDGRTHARQAALCFALPLLLISFTAAIGNSAEPEGKPFGITARIPLTTSRVTGRPDPPLPYIVRRAYPEFAVDFPVCLVAEPGTKNFFLSSQPRSFGDSKISRLTIHGGDVKSEVLLESPDVVYSLCVHPKFRENGFLYVGSKGPQSGGQPKKCRITRYTVSRTAPEVIDSESVLKIIEWDSDGHDGTAMAFGLDGLFYVTTGDGTSDSDGNIVGQRLDLILAKVLRIDVDHPDPGRGYSVPEDNPFVGQENVLPETWAYGLRAPWRAHVDSRTGQLWVTQNGQDLWEQVYAVRKGANYGWSVYEGSHPFYLERQLGPTPHTLPTFEHHHSEARSLTGGIVYYGEKFPELQGAYIYGDYSTGKIWAGKLDSAGNVSWHREIADTTLAITSFVEDASGELLITDHRGQGQGGIYALEPNPDSSTNSDFPRTLTSSGLFASVSEHEMAPGVIPYSVNSPLWSDGTFKARFITLPESAGENGQPPQITSHPQNAWSFPNGTVLVKSFAIDEALGESTRRRWIETRFLLREQNEWVGYSYGWNDEQTDAELVSAGGSDKSFSVRLSDGTVRDLKWHYPSRTECMVCHSRAAGFVLGLSTSQMNRDHDYDGVVDNQLRTLKHLGILQGLDKSPDECDRLADPYDPSQPLEARVRSYLHSNCAHCHVEAGGGNAQMDLKYTVPLDRTKLIGVSPLHHKFEIQDAQIVAGGDPDRSVLIHRMLMRTPGQMPPIATSIPDVRAVELFREWVTSLTQEP